MNRTLLFAVVALVGLLFSGPLRADEKPEPKYEGKPLSYWMERLRKSENDKERKDIFSNLKDFGPDAAPAVPALVEMLDDHSVYYRQCVGEVLCAIGPAAKSAVPALVRSLKEKTARSPKVVIEVLGKIGPDAKEAVRVLVAATEDPKLRYEAVSALCQIRPPANEILPAIERAIRNEISQGNGLWFWLVSDLALLKGDAVPLLVELLKEQDKEVKGAAVKALGDIGPPAKAACPALTKSLEHEDAKVRLEAARALWKIDKNPAGVPVLTALLEEQNLNSLTDMNAANLLGDMGWAAKAAIPALEKALAGDNLKRLQRAATTAIDKIRADKPKND